MLFYRLEIIGLCDWDIGSLDIKFVLSINISLWGDSKLLLTSDELLLSFGGQILITRFDAFGLQMSPNANCPNLTNNENSWTP
jgi:hypothetical protein